MAGTLIPWIDSPEKLRELPEKELPRLAREIRDFIIRCVEDNGGHLASNLGVVELTIALHRVFHSPQDKIVWDVGHQCYAHKLLTGRRAGLLRLRRLGGASGFPRRAESVHDVMDTGHASTSISSAIGLLSGQKLLGVPGKVVAVIGDGALSGGLALEALNYAGHVPNDLIIVLNDNEMSISRNVGALSAYLSRLTTTPYYQRLRDRIDRGILVVPFVGRKLLSSVYRMKRGIKAIFFKKTLFSDLGYEYAGPIDGHNMRRMIDVFRAVKGLSRPTVVHVITKKGKGHSAAEDDPSHFHGVGPSGSVRKGSNGCVDPGPSPTNGANATPVRRPSYTEVFSDAVLRFADGDAKIVALTAAMAEGTGLLPFCLKYPGRFFDLGIAEAHAVTFAAALASTGLRPVLALYSTFVQRAVDQMIHDVALPGFPLVLCLDRAGLVPGDGATHQGVFDFALFRSVPGLSLLAPACEEEFRAMLAWAFGRPRPVVIRYPKDDCPSIPALAAPIEEGRGVWALRRDARTAIVTPGALVAEALQASRLLDERAKKVDVYSLRFVRPLDEDHLAAAFGSFDAVYAIEDGAQAGGAGEALRDVFARRLPGCRFFHRGVPDRFMTHATRAELLAECGLDANGIAEWLAGLE